MTTNVISNKRDWFHDILVAGIHVEVNTSTHICTIYTKGPLSNRIRQYLCKEGFLPPQSLVSFKNPTEYVGFPKRSGMDDGKIFNA